MFNYQSLGELQYKQKFSSQLHERYIDNIKHLEPIAYLQGIHGETCCICKNADLFSQLDLINKMYDGLPSNSSITEVLLLDSYHSATIEGARTTLDSVKRSIESGKASSKSDKMVYNVFMAVSSALSNGIKSESDMLGIWRLIVNGVCENTSV